MFSSHILAVTYSFPCTSIFSHAGLCQTGHPITQQPRPDIFDLPGMIAWTIINWLLGAISAVMTFIVQNILHYGFVRIIDSPSYMYLYVLMRDISLAILGITFLFGLITTLFPQKQSSYNSNGLVRLLTTTSVAVVLLMTRIPIVVMNLIYFVANKATTTLLQAGLTGIPQTLIGTGTHGMSNTTVTALFLGILLRYGTGFGFLFFLLMLGILFIFILCIFAQILGQIAGLLMTLFIPVAVAFYMFDYGRKWLRRLIEFVSVAAFAQVFSTVYLLFVLVLIMNLFTGTINPMGILVTFGMAFLSVIPAQRLISLFAGVMHTQAGSLMEHSQFLQQQTGSHLASAGKKAAQAGAAAASGGTTAAAGVAAGAASGAAAGASAGGAGGAVSAALMNNSGGVIGSNGPSGGASVGASMHESLLPNSAQDEGGSQAYEMQHGIKGAYDHYPEDFNFDAPDVGVGNPVMAGSASAVASDLSQADTSPSVAAASTASQIAGSASDESDVVEAKWRDRSNVIGLARHSIGGMPGNLGDPVGHGKGAYDAYKARGAANRARDIERGKAMLDSSKTAINSGVNTSKAALGRITNKQLRDNAKPPVDPPKE